MKTAEIDTEHSLVKVDLKLIPNEQIEEDDHGMIKIHTLD